MNAIFSTIIIILVIQFFSYLIAYKKQTDKLTDLVYGSTFALLSGYLLSVSDLAHFQISIALLVIVWGVRLSGYLFLRIKRMKKDKRFDDMRASWVSFGKFWILQSISIFIIFLPVLFVLTNNSSSRLSFLFYLGTAFSTIGFLVEVIADYQKSRFKSIHGNSGKPMIHGLYRFLRFPNYSGEILFWIGIYLSSITYLTGWEHIAIISPLWISFLLIRISGIPLLEQNHQKKYGDLALYNEYTSKTAKLFPYIY